MDELAKQSASYQLDQEILDARGIDMKVEEVAGLPTCKYAEKVQALNLGDGDLVFLKGLRRRIKNRLASQNSRRRSMEHLRRLARELRAVRQCRDDALSERRGLIQQRDVVREHCVRLRRHLVQILRERSDTTTVPEEELEEVEPPTRTKLTDSVPLRSRERSRERSESPLHVKEDSLEELESEMRFYKKEIFECRIEKLVQQSVNHMYKDRERKTICAKTIFITDKCPLEESGVLNLSLREGRKSHGRKQSAPRRITYIRDSDDAVLDLKIKKEPQ